MNFQSFKNSKGLIILLSAIGILLIFTVDLFKLSYQLKSWEPFGEMPVPASEILYFVADTPNLIGYTDPESRTRVSCATTVAYVRMASGDRSRCCNTGDKISCLPGDYSNEIPVIDEACTESLRQAFAVPGAVEGAVEYHLYGSCTDSPASRLTVVQMNDEGQILWKFLDGEEVLFLAGMLRCIVAPLLLVLIIVMVVLTARAIPKEPIPRF